MTQVLDDPQVAAREMVIKVDHPVAGQVSALGCPIKFSHGNGVTSRGAPLYGEHTAEVMQELGYQKSEISRMAGEGAVHVHVHGAFQAEPAAPQAALSSQ
jgi:formyl-CoA transferase